MFNNLLTEFYLNFVVVLEMYLASKTSYHKRAKNGENS